MIKVRQNEARDSARREVVDHVFDPGEVGVPDGRNTILPPHVVAETVPAQSLMLKAGFARMKSALRSGCRSLRKVSAWWGPRLASIPRIARFIFASFHVVGFDSCPKIEMSPIRPPCWRMNSSL